MKVYHYTNKEGADGIKASKRIKKSRRKIRDAYFGDGVYFTSLTPDNSTEDLSYEMFGQHDGHRSKTRYYFEFDAHEIGAKKVSEKYGREIYKTDGDVDLSEVEYRFGEREV